MKTSRMQFPKYTLGFILFLLSLLPLFSLLRSGMFIAHDSLDHVGRIANFYTSLAEGNFVPRWAGKLNWGYGHPILMFLYPLSSYLASVFLGLGIGLVTSVKLVFAVSFVASVMAMYWWLKAEFGKTAGFVGAMLYGFAPYRFVDLYVRGAIGEHVAFACISLLFGCVLKMSRSATRRGAYLWALGIAGSLGGLILSHNAVSLMIIPLFIGYALYCGVGKEHGNGRFFSFLVISIFLGFGLAAFFWVPALFEGKYTLREIVTKDDTFARFVPVRDLFKLTWSYGGSGELSKNIGVVQWMLTSVGVLFLFLKKTGKRGLLCGCLFVLAASLFLMTEWSRVIWVYVPILKQFQFPWRFLTVSVLASSVVGAIVTEEVIGRMKLDQRWVVSGIVGALLLTTFWMWKPQGYDMRPEARYWDVYHGTTDTGESSPIWSVRFMEALPSIPVDVIDGDARITPILRSSTKHRYEIDVTKHARIVENTLYFPGWRVLVDGVQTDIQFQDPQYRGLMTFDVGEGKHVVSVEFGDTKVRMIANIITGISALFFIASLLGISLWKKRT